MADTTDNFWLNDPMILIKKNNWYKIFPSKRMSTTEILNALTRFFICVMILYLIFAGQSQCIYIPIIAILVIIILYYVQKSEKPVIKNVGNEENFIVDTKKSDHNPHMNITMAKLIGDQTPVHMQRQFYTMPSTTIPNDQTGFAKFLYQLPTTCKEDSAQCLRYEDVRYSRVGLESETVQKENN